MIEFINPNEANEKKATDYLRLAAWHSERARPYPGEPPDRKQRLHAKAARRIERLAKRLLGEL